MCASVWYLLGFSTDGSFLLTLHPCHPRTPWRPSPAAVTNFSDVTAPRAGGSSRATLMASLSAGPTERGREQVVPGTSLAPSVFEVSQPQYESISKEEAQE